MDFKKLTSKLYSVTKNIEKTILIISIMSITMIIFTNTALRFTVGISITWAEEVSRYIMVWLVFVGASVCLRDGEHVNIDIFLDLIPEGKLKNFIIRVIVLICFLFSLFFLNWAFMQTKTVWISGQVTPISRIPMYYIYGGMLLGCFLLSIDFFILVMLKLKPSPTSKFVIDKTEE